MAIAPTLRMQRGPLIITIPSHNNSLRLQVHTGKGCVFAPVSNSARPPSPRPTSPYTPNTPVEQYEPLPVFHLETEFNGWQRRIALRDKYINDLILKRKQFSRRKEALVDAIERVNQQAKHLDRQEIPSSPASNSPSLTCRSWEQFALGNKIAFRQKLASEVTGLNGTLSAVCNADIEYARKIRSNSVKLHEESHAEGLQIFTRGFDEWIKLSSDADDNQTRTQVKARARVAYDRSNASLNLDNMQLKELPEALIVLRKLKSMSACRNQLRELPPLLARMDGLQELHLSNNQFQHLPAHLPPNLTMLSFVDNPASTDPEEVIKMQHLMSKGLAVFAL